MTLPTRTPLSLPEIVNTDWVPQAVIRRPVEVFLRTGMTPHEGHDDLDRYDGVYGTVNGVKLAFIRHHGNPIGSCQLFLDPTAQDLDLITAVVAMVEREFRLREGDVVWQRRDGLDDEAKLAQIRESLSGETTNG